jgi:RHS repeat-associated protein
VWGPAHPVSRFCEQCACAHNCFRSEVAYNLRFPGQIFDGQAGLHQNGFRSYDPATGKYVASDPIGLMGGINTYAYVGSSPLLGADPLGLIFPDFDEIFGNLFRMPWDKERCENLQNRINGLWREMEGRYKDIRESPGNLPMYGPGPNHTTIQGHYRIIKRLDSQRRSLEDDYDKHCRNGPPSCRATSNADQVQSQVNDILNQTEATGGILELIGSALVLF